MPDEESAMPDKESALHETVTEDAGVQPPETLAYEPLEPEDDGTEAREELPRRPRRRLLAPTPVALLIVLMTACGFIAGVLVEKGQGSSAGSAGAASGLAARLAGLRGGTTAGGATGASRSGSGGGGGLAGAFAGAGAAASGQVAFIQGGELYVTNAEGNTVKVTTSPGSTVTKTVKSSVKDIHPGETVVVTGSKGSGGVVSAESIRVGGGASGGLAALFGGAGAGGSSGSAGAGGSGAASRGSRSSGGGAGGGSSGGPALFGPG